MKTTRQQRTEYTLPGGITFRMVPVPGGSFRMGASKDPADPNYDPEAGDNETPHPVTLNPFWLGETPVTQAQWTALTGKNPAGFTEKGENCPVEQVSWFDAVAFCNLLSSEMNRTPCYRDTSDRVFGLQDPDRNTWAWENEGVVVRDLSANGFRLPTEAEWECAARGGPPDPDRPERSHWYAGSDLLEQVGWFDENAGDRTRPVGLLLPNELGLFDMSGNVFEWCEDWYGPYEKKPPPNPTGPEKGDDRVVRGGDWYFYRQFCRAAYRGSRAPDYRYYDIGFRLALQSA